MKTYCMMLATNNPFTVCEGIDELCELYKSIKILSIVKEKANHFIYYQLGEKKK